MYELKRIVVAVNLTELDEEVVRYASIVSRIMDADSVYFVHVAETLDLPDDLAEEYRQVLAPVDETIQHEMQHLVDDYFPHGEHTQVSIDVLQGNPTDELIRYGKQKDADLIILGKPDGFPRKPKLRKVAEISTCSVLFVPEGADIKIDKIAVALDFSDHAQRALSQAIKFTEEGKDVTIYGHHVYQIPKGYSKTGKSYEDFSQIMEENAKKESKKFFDNHNLDKNICEMRYQLSEDTKIDDELFGFAQQKDVDLMIIGSRGRTAAASILLGSVAERLLAYHTNIPLFMVKEKNSNMSFLEALLSL
ncbi:universal stress protein [Tunicatimonas pelagia]|uniref:universal stress protein n=1 Tax=Tunicatimonas pelagia TaxID=931531 RepID=UPI0026665139|nr:universal stress protein [Tunicatimonas pelagia]WKN41092.1 universal stress protein [Tunicatimonas pelagia]